MSDLDNDEIQATRKLNVLDDELFKEKEIENGEYVRTDRGEIAKVTSVAKETLGETLGANEYRSIGFCNTEPYVYGNIVKHSKQPIDLIDKDDYVNGYKVIKLKDGFSDGTMEIVLSNNTIIYRHHSEDIKTILTKESYVANCYKVGGEE